MSEKIQIRHRDTNAVLFECDAPADLSSGLRMRHALGKATQAGAILAGADLEGADLAGANLAGASLALAALAAARDARDAARAAQADELRRVCAEIAAGRDPYPAAGGVLA